MHVLGTKNVLQPKPGRHAPLKYWYLYVRVWFPDSWWTLVSSTQSLLNVTWGLRMQNLDAEHCLETKSRYVLAVMIIRRLRRSLITGFYSNNAGVLTHLTNRLINNFVCYCIIWTFECWSLAKFFVQCPAWTISHNVSKETVVTLQFFPRSHSNCHARTGH